MSNDTQELTLAEFLLARIAEDETEAAVVRDHASSETGPTYLRGNLDILEVTTGYARVLAECEAKRRIVELYRVRVAQDADEDDYWSRQVTTTRCEELEAVLGLLASTYADHPDYRDEWR